MSGETPEIVEYPRGDDALRDGIGEEDNPIPLWFNVGFYALIVVGVIYIFFYTLSGWSQLGEYEAQVAAAAVRSEAVRAALPTTNITLCQPGSRPPRHPPSSLSLVTLPLRVSVSPEASRTCAPSRRSPR